MMNDDDEDNNNPLGLDQHNPAENGVDALLKVAKESGPEAYQKFLKSELFEMATRFDKRYHPELQHENSCNKLRS